MPLSVEGACHAHHSNIFRPEDITRLGPDEMLQALTSPSLLHQIFKTILIATRLVRQSQHCLILHLHRFDASNMFAVFSEHESHERAYAGFQQRKRFA